MSACFFSPQKFEQSFRVVKPSTLGVWMKLFICFFSLTTVKLYEEVKTTWNIIYSQIIRPKIAKFCGNNEVKNVDIYGPLNAT